MSWPSIYRFSHFKLSCFLHSRMFLDIALLLINVQTTKLRTSTRGGYLWFRAQFAVQVSNAVRSIYLIKKKCKWKLELRTPGIFRTMHSSTNYEGAVCVTGHTDCGSLIKSVGETVKSGFLKILQENFFNILCPAESKSNGLVINSVTDLCLVNFLNFTSYLISIHSVPTNTFWPMNVLHCLTIWWIFFFSDWAQLQDIFSDSWWLCYILDLGKKSDGWKLRGG